MIKPTYFVSPITPYKTSSPDEPLAGRIVPKEIIVAGSLLTISGLVGLSVVGFLVFRNSNNKVNPPHA